MKPIELSEAAPANPSPAPAAAPSPATVALLASLTAAFGALLAVQVDVNARAGERFGLSFSGAIFTFASGAAYLLILTRAEVDAANCRRERERGRGAGAGAEMRWLAWREWPTLADLSPGVLGALYVVGSVLISNVIGSASFWIACIAGQLLSAQLLDHLGLSGGARKPFTVVKGALLLLAAGGAALSVIERVLAALTASASLLPLVGCLAASAAVGAVMPVQAALSKSAAEKLPSRLAAAFYTFLVGFLVAAAAFGAQCALEPAAAAAFLGRFAGAPVFDFAGGAFGVFYVASSIAFTPIIGSAVYFVCFCCGQLLGSAAVDSTGLFGAPVHAVTPLRAGGIALVFVAAVSLAAFADALTRCLCGAGAGDGGGAGDGADTARRREGSRARGLSVNGAPREVAVPLLLSAAEEHKLLPTHKVEEVKKHAGFWT